MALATSTSNFDWRMCCFDCVPVLYGHGLEKVLNSCIYRQNACPQN